MIFCNRFKLDKKKKMYVLTDWITNGHFATHRHYPFTRHDVKNALKYWWLMREGCYEGGEQYSATTPDMSRVIPEDLDGYEKSIITSEALYEPSDETFRAVILVSEPSGIRVGIAPEYVPLLKGAQEVLIKNSKTAVVLRCADETVGLVMPVRIDEKGEK